MPLPRTLYYASAFPVPEALLRKDWRQEAANGGYVILSRTADIASDWVETDWEDRDDGSDLNIFMYEISSDDLIGKAKPIKGSTVDFRYRIQPGEMVEMQPIPWARLDADEA